MIIEQYIEIMKNMNYDEKISYAFQMYYEYKNDKYLSNVFFLVIAHLISKYNLTLDTNKLNGISDNDKKIIIDSTYRYIYEEEKSLRGPILNIFGEILDSEQPYITPYLDLLKMLSYNKYMKK